MVVVQSYKDLRVWQAGMDVVEQVYDITKRFPTQERYALASQSQRAAVSIPSHIAEGHARQHRAGYLQHLSIAQASLAELETQLEIAFRLKYVAKQRTAKLSSDLDSLGRQLRTLRTTLAKTKS